MIKLVDLECYKKSSCEAKKRNNGALAFETDLIQSSCFKKEVEAFIMYKGQMLSLSSIRAMVSPANVLIRFISMQEEKKSFVLFGRLEMEKKYKVYLYKNNYPITRKRYRKYRDNTSVVKSEYMAIFDNYYNWLEVINDKRSEKDKDVWDVRKLDVKICQNPVNPRYRLDFRKIPLDFRLEVKEALYFQATIKAMHTLQGEIRAANNFFGFLNEYCPRVRCMDEIDREKYENYLIWRKIESGASPEVIKRELSDLKTLFSVIAMLYEQKNLSELFFSRDGIKCKDKLPVIYSKEEIRRFNEALENQEKQMIRALLIHELVGTRISDTLTLTKDCLLEDGNSILIKQTKTKKAYKKHISGKVRALIMKSIEFIEEKGIETEYIFADEQGKPWTYGKIVYRMEKMINDKNLCMDSGERFKFLSHQFRRTLATNMTEIGLPDRYIAHELGHSSTYSVARYRRVRNSEIKTSIKKLEGYINFLYCDDYKDEENGD